MSASNDEQRPEPPIRVPIINSDSRRWTETYREKAIRKTQENPWVPLGTLITTGALVMSAVRLRQGDSRKFQVWLRYRVGFQALTIVAILGGIYKYGQGNLEENQRIMEQMNQQRGERRQLEDRAELERRIQNAEREQQEEAAMMSGGRKQENVSSTSASASAAGGIWSTLSWGKRPETAVVPETPKAAPPPSPIPVSPPPPSSTAAGFGSSWWNVFGWGKPSSNSTSDSDSKKNS